MPRDAVSRTANVGTVGINGLNTRFYNTLNPLYYTLCIALEMMMNTLIDKSNLLYFKGKDFVPIPNRPIDTVRKPINSYKKLIYKYIYIN